MSRSPHNCLQTVVAPLLASMLFAACGRDIPPTEVIVTVEAESGIRNDIDRVNVRLLSAAAGNDQRMERMDRDFEGGIAWPLVFLVTPIGRDASRTFELIARAYDGETEIGRVRAVTGFVKEDTRYLTLTFTNSCRKRLCDEGRTCEAGECVSADIEADDLDEHQADPAGDGDSNMDAGARPDTPNTLMDPNPDQDMNSDASDCTGTWNSSLFGQACWGE